METMVNNQNRMKEMHNQRVKHLTESALVEQFRSLLFVLRIGQRFARPHTSSSVQREIEFANFSFAVSLWLTR